MKLIVRCKINKNIRDLEHVKKQALKVQSGILIRIPENLDASLNRSYLFLQCEIIIAMDCKIAIPKSVCNDEVVDYIAGRYSITPQQVINHFMCQEGVIKDTAGVSDREISFEENEMAILRDMGLCPSYVEFEETEI